MPSYTSNLQLSLTNFKDNYRYFMSLKEVIYELFKGNLGLFKGI